MRFPIPIVLLWCACGSHEQHVVEPEAEPAIVQQDARLWLAPPRAGARRAKLISRHDGYAHYTLGALRVRVSSEGRVELAPAFAGRIDSAVRCGDGWLFSSDQSVVAYAREFLGPLERVGDFAFPTLSGGRIAALVDEDSFSSVRCGEHAVLTRESPRHVVAARVVGDQQVVITLFDTQWRTGDGAWARVDLGGEAGLTFVSAPSGEIWVDTSGGVYAIDGHGRAQRQPETQQQDGQEHNEREAEPVTDERALADRSRISASLRLNGLDEGHPTRWLPDGSLVVSTPTAPSVILPNGRRLPVPSDCTLVEGARLAFLCGQTLFAAEADAFGRSLVRRNLGSFEGSADRMILLANGRVLVERPDGLTGCETGVCLFDLASGEGTPLPVDELPMAPNVLGSEALLENDEGDSWLHLRADGSIDRYPIQRDVDLILAPNGVVWSVRRRQDLTSPGRGINDGEIVSLQQRDGLEIAVPAGKLLVRTQSDAIFLVGTTLDSMIRSTDHGQNWVRVEPDPRVDGRIDLEDLLTLDDVYFSASCEAGPCPFGDDLVVHERPLGPFRELPILGRRVLFPEPQIHPQVRPVCERQASVQGEAGPLGVLSHRIVRGQARVAWRGLDEAGFYRSEADLTGFEPRCFPQLRDRDAAILSCPHGDESEALLEFVLVRVGRPPLRLTSPIRAPAKVGGLFVDAERGMVLIPEWTHNRYVSLVVTWNGEQVERRRFRFRAQLEYAAWIDDRPALAIRRWGDALSRLDVHFVDDGELREITFPEPSLACPDATGNTNLVRVSPIMSVIFAGAPGASLDAFVLAIGPEPTCVRSIETAGLLSALRDERVAVLASVPPRLPRRWEVAARAAELGQPRLRGQERQRIAALLGALEQPADCVFEAGFRSSVEIRVDSGSIRVEPQTNREEDECIAAGLQDGLASHVAELPDGTFEATFILGERPPWPLTQMQCTITVGELLSTLPQ